MSIELQTAKNACDKFEQLIKLEHPALALEFILFSKGQASAALERKRLKINSHPAGNICWPHLKIYGDNEKKSPAFTGISIATERSISSFFIPKKQAIAFFFLCIDDFENLNHFKSTVLSLIWHALSLYTQHKKSTLNSKDHPFITPNNAPLQRAKDNLLADSFAAFSLELMGEKNAIHRIAKDRCLKAISPLPHYRAEFYPFPMALDAIQIIYSDLGTQEARERPIANAYEMANEVLFTIDEQSIYEWINFALAAHQMAWLGVPHKNILGAAVYHSEGIHMRSTGYIIAETLNIDPVLPLHFNGYDPFSGSEINENRYKKAQQANLTSVLQIINDPQNKLQDKIIALTQKAMESNKRLVAGDPIHWSAYPVIRIIEALEGMSKNINRPLEDIATPIFEKSAQEIAWSSMVELNKLIMMERRNEALITGTYLAQRILETQIPQAELITHAIGIHGNDLILENNEPPLHLDIPLSEEPETSTEDSGKGKEIEDLPESTLDFAQKYEEAPSILPQTIATTGKSDAYLPEQDSSLTFDDEELPRPRKNEDAYDLREVKTSLELDEDSTKKE